MGRHTTGAHTVLSVARTDATVKEVCSYTAHVQWEAIFVKSQRKSYKLCKLAQLSILEQKSFKSSTRQEPRNTYVYGYVLVG